MNIMWVRGSCNSTEFVINMKLITVDYAHIQSTFSVYIHRKSRTLLSQKELWFSTNEPSLKLLGEETPTPYSGSFSVLYTSK